MIDLRNRSQEKELMDDLGCEGSVVEQTLKELDIINRKLGGNQISIEGLKELVTQKDNQQIVLADLGCGGGDILIEMAQWATRHHINIKFVGIDANPHIISYAKKHCENYPEISFESVDIWSEAFLRKKYDIIHSSLFTHHFSDEQLVGLFSKLKDQTRLGIIVNDLHRHWIAYYSIKWITWIFSRSQMVRNDAAISVARAFKRKDLANILKESGFQKARIKWKWAFRWKVVCSTL